MSVLPRVALIVINWNGGAYLEECLSSLLKLSYPKFSVTVVDNASTDGSPDRVQHRFPQVELVRSPYNLGFGGGANLVLRACQADIAVVLNTDISVPADWLTHLVVPMMDDPAIGIAGSKMYYPGGRIIQHAGGYITGPQAWPGHYGLNDEDAGQLDTLRDVDYVIGAALAMKRVVLEQVGLFDEGYFLYYEDVDLCLRARRAGYRVVYIPGAWLTHIESATTVKGSDAYLQRFSLGRWRFILKHYDPGKILSDSIPAERAWLARCCDAEQRASAVAYRAIIEDLPEIRQARARDGGIYVREMTDEEQNLIAGQLQALLETDRQVPEPLSTPEVWHIMNDKSTTPRSPLQLLQTRQQIQEQPFVSHVPLFGPLIARLRSAWNSVSTKWYVRPLLQQQNEFNELAANQLIDQDTRLQEQQVRLGDHERRLSDHEHRLGEQAAYSANLEARVHDHDAWLVAQDREQSELVHDLAEVRVQLTQMNRLLHDLDQRVSRLEAEHEPQKKDGGA